MKSALLIGIGNTLRGDDGVGIRVAERARARFPHLTVLCVQGLSPELADTVAPFDLLLIVDACVATTTLRVSEVTPAVSGETHPIAHHVPGRHPGSCGNVVRSCAVSFGADRGARGRLRLQ